MGASRGTVPKCKSPGNGCHASVHVSVHSGTSVSERCGGGSARTVVRAACPGGCLMLLDLIRALCAAGAAVALARRFLGVILPPAPGPGPPVRLYHGRSLCHLPGPGPPA